MKASRFTPLLLIALLFGAAGFHDAAEAKSSKKVIKIYCVSYSDSEKGYEGEKLFGMVPVFRTITGKAFAYKALTALFAGPNEEEKKRDLHAPYTEYLAIKRLSIKRGTVRVSLRTMQPQFQRWPGDLAPIRFIQAIERTLKQFPTIGRVMICLDGYEAYSIAGQRELKRCH